MKNIWGLTQRIEVVKKEWVHLNTDPQKSSNLKKEGKIIFEK